MATGERGCANCGAINHFNADACWRCLESLVQPSPVAANAEQTPEPASEPRTASR